MSAQIAGTWGNGFSKVITSKQELTVNYVKSQSCLHI